MRHTLQAPEKPDTDIMKVVESLYAEGVLPYAMLGLQCIGFKEDFDTPMRKWEAQMVQDVADVARTSPKLALPVTTGAAMKRKDDGPTVDPRKRPRVASDTTMKLEEAEQVFDELPGLLKQAVIPKERFPKKKAKINSPLGRVKRTGAGRE